MYLEAVSALGHAAVVADRQWQEVELQIRMTGVLHHAHETAGLEMRGRAGTPAIEQPAQTDPEPVPGPEQGIQRHRTASRVLHVDLEMILQMPTDVRQRMQHGDIQVSQQGGITDARQHEQLRRADRAAAEHHCLPIDAGCERERPADLPAVARAASPTRILRIQDHGPASTARRLDRCMQPGVS